MVMADVKTRSKDEVASASVQVVNDDFNGAVLVGPLPLVMSEDEDDEAIMTIVESLPVGGDNVGRKDVSILAELGDKGWRRAIVRVGANVEGS